MEKRVSKIRLFDPVIGPDVDTWMIDLDYITEEEIKKAKPFLHHEELQRSQQFVFDQYRHHFVIRRALLKMVLSKYVNLDPKMIEISYGQYKKPYLANHEHIYFNFSHTDKKGVLAVSKSGEVGVDIEFIRRVRNREEILKQIASKDESVWGGRSIKQFLIMWTMKEALIKFDGSGFLAESIPHMDQLPIEIAKNMFVAKISEHKIYSKIVHDNIISICL